MDGMHPRRSLNSIDVEAGKHSRQPRRARIRPATLRHRRNAVARAARAEHDRAHLRGGLVQHVVHQRVLVLPHLLQLAARLL